MITGLRRLALAVAAHTPGGTYIVISRLPRRRSNSRSELMLLKGGSRVPIPPPWGGHGDLDDCGSSRPENPRRENVARRVLDSCGDQRRRQLFLDRGLKGGRGVGLREGSSIVEQLERRRDRSAPCDVLQREIVKKRNLLEPLVPSPSSGRVDVQHRRL